MPRAEKKRNKRSKQAATVAPKIVFAQKESKPVHGVKLKTVSAFTMLFALICLAAFIAARPPVSAAGPAQDSTLTRSKVNDGPLRHDDARRLFGRAPGKGKLGAKKTEKSARARASVRFLPVDAKQKNQQTENI